MDGPYLVIDKCNGNVFSDWPSLAEAREAAMDSPDYAPARLIPSDAVVLVLSPAEARWLEGYFDIGSTEYEKDLTAKLRAAQQEVTG